MFYDERIEQVKGKIIRNAIIMSTTISVIMCIMNVMCLLGTRGSHYLTPYTTIMDCVIALTGIVCLLIGLKHGRTCIRDERTIFEKVKYYKKISWVILIVDMFAFASLLPMSLRNSVVPFASLGVETTLIILFFVIGMYVFYSFRKNNIYFNYSIIEQKHYYFYVFKNIGKLFLGVFIMAIISSISTVIFGSVEELNMDYIIRYMLTYAIALYVIMFVGLSVVYLIFSFMESLSYNSNTFTSKPIIIVSLLTICFYAMTILTFVLDYRGDNGSLARAIVYAAVEIFLFTCIKFACVLFVSYFGAECKKNRHFGLLPLSCDAIIIGEIMFVLFLYL